MSGIHTVSDNLNLNALLYAVDRSLSCPMCRLTKECNVDIELVSMLIHSKVDKLLIGLP